eukprot:CAMPEP_0177656280 /NCGR_PEP_ID=MMETSP0447-20121125/15468_1 /TAXON_ID=0 /ORGANISM="Stygamoeba regulata, Strain BSH-02190019" /LENGTH=766 /DNA_ID=CAMNT_0019160359 /DNA_START=213 /DNA_END=2510 /DNA_ORIENTATION=-
MLQGSGRGRLRTSNDELADHHSAPLLHLSRLLTPGNVDAAELREVRSDGGCSPSPSQPWARREEGHVCECVGMPGRLASIPHSLLRQTHSGARALWRGLRCAGKIFSVLLLLLFLWVAGSVLTTQGARPLGMLVSCHVCQAMVSNTYEYLKDHREESLQAQDAFRRSCWQWHYSFQCWSFELVAQSNYIAWAMLQTRSTPEVICTAMWFCTDTCCLTPTVPEQVHLALTDRPDEMLVMWTTERPLLFSHVRWIRFPDEDDSQISELVSPNSNEVAAYTLEHAKTRTLARGDYSQARGVQTTFQSGGWNGMLHAAVIHSLEPGTYVYQVGSPETGRSAVHTFVVKAPNALSSGRAAIRIGYIADMGTDACSDLTVEALEIEAGLMHNPSTKLQANRTSLSLANTARGLDLLLHAGDISYMKTCEYMADVFMRKIEGVVASVPYMVTVGNHEAYWSYATFRNRFKMPSPASTPAEMQNRWWSKDVGPLHIISYSTEDSLARFSDQMIWLLADLDDVARRDDPIFDREMGEEEARLVSEGLTEKEVQHKLHHMRLDRVFTSIEHEFEPQRGPRHTKWIIMVGHTMTYCASDVVDCPGVAEHIRELLEPFLHAYHVDLVLNGHSHLYERTFPVYRGRAAMDGLQAAPLPHDCILTGEGMDMSEQPVNESRWFRSQDECPYSPAVEDIFLNPRATIFVNNGLAGAHADEEGKCNFDTFLETVPHWMACRAALPGYAVLTVQGNTLTYEAKRADTQKTFDGFTIHKPDLGSP